MPLPIQAEEKLAEFSVASGDFALFGIAMNSVTGEIATFSSHGTEPGRILGILQQAVNQMISAAASGELEYVGGEYGSEAQTRASAQGKTGGKIALIH